MSSELRPPSYRSLRFVGVSKRGQSMSGARMGAPADVAESLFRDGYRWAKITADGEVVGEVTNGDEGRSWWGER